ncbi:hypothetical protein [Rhodospirillum centenum]|uniref:Uncharacterized protein n=1 Tax=Rhodospirillum centenum (strain ATCC 51521 / SW) TaxID=414684 RepID=B6INL2_RHOCS|nr:hypothetical protein [Rhodospirillum centenum]ACI99109.1 hypothetical protein RC1_1711 [Rhodospirillum centenum SW]
MTENGQGRNRRPREDRLDRGVKIFYLATLALMLYGAVSALLRLA